MTKSMKYHYPAEFIVPTYVPYDVGPIGYAFETEFERQEVPIGLQLSDMLEGILTVGGTTTQRFLTNFNLVYETAMAEGNYLIITTSPEWRRLLDLIPEACVLRLGEDFTINIMDPERAELSEYATILTQVFAQALQLTRSGIERLSQSIITLLTGSNIPDINELKSNLESKSVEPRGFINKEMDTIFQFLQNMSYGPVSRIFGETMIPFNQFMHKITVIEIDLKVQQQLHFFLLCLLAKVIICGRTHQNQHCMVLVDIADSLVPLDPKFYKTRETEQYFLDWVRRLKRNNIGLHLSIQIPSRFPTIILNTFKTILAHQITAYEDVKITRNLLQFLPDQMVHSNLRHDNYQVEYLKTLTPNMYILKRVDIPNAFPVQIPEFNFSGTHVWTSTEIQSRIASTFSGWSEPPSMEKTTIEKDFGLDTPIILKVLSLLEEYPELGKQGFLSALNSDPEIALDMPQFERLLHKLVAYNYIVMTEHEDGRGHRHHSYQLIEKGQQAYYVYLEELRRAH
ncbi:MAG: hypothetical protein ACFFD2_11030 [Promethearchaeota archaeon]